MIGIYSARRDHGNKDTTHIGRFDVSSTNNWFLYQDGSIELDVKLTGILNTAALLPGETTKFGTLIAPRLYAPNHQHFFCVRMDMAIDGQNNKVVEMNTVADPTGPENPYGNAFYGQATAFNEEQEAQRIVNPLTARYWKISNPESLNWMEQPVAYKLIPGENVLPFAQPDSSIAKRGGYMWKHLCKRNCNRYEWLYGL